VKANPRRLIGIALLAIYVAGCGPDAPQSGRVVAMLESPAGGGPTHGFAAAVAYADGTRELINCRPGPGLLDSRCGSDRLTLQASSNIIRLTVKAQGYGWSSAKYHLALVEPSRFADISVQLVPLPVPSETEDFVTGFGVGASVEALEALAFTSAGELGSMQMVKFFIANLPDDPVVYFQNTVKHQLHYDFAVNVLGMKMTHSEFGAQVYSGEERSGMAGTLVRYPELTASSGIGTTLESPVTLTFFPSGGLSWRLALDAHRLIEERLGFSNPGGLRDRLVYVPAGSSQEQDLLAASEEFDLAGAEWMTHEDLSGGLQLQILNRGLAFGTLKLMTPQELESGVVSYTDIIVLTNLPNSLPIVGGTITEELQTPLAHVNVAARNRDTPNIALLGASTDDLVAPFLGKLVRFEVAAGGFAIETATPDEAQAFWESRQVDPVTLAYDLLAQELSWFHELGFDESATVGSKAANLAELSVLLPDSVPAGFAIPFHYYQQFLDSSELSDDLCLQAGDDCLDEGRHPPACLAACQICLTTPKPEKLSGYLARLLGDGLFRTDSLVREAALDGVRFAMRHSPVDAALAKELDGRVAGLTGMAPVRLRSSTNTEDLDGFSGAGLYESVSAYAAGPKAASNRVRRVWASVWNWRAYEERSFWNIDHLDVKMGVAVHRSFPLEAANGVLITRNLADPNVVGMYVNVQPGEVSVTNPGQSAIPEVFSIIPKPLGGVQVARQRFSSLSPDQAILAQSEVEELHSAATQIQSHFASLYGKDPYGFALDLEFKFHGAERKMIIKQVRPYMD